MKQFFSIILAGIIGGLVVYGTLSHTLDHQEQQEVSKLNSTPKATFTGSSSNVAFDFTEAAKISTPAVVHIYAKESEQLANSRKPTHRNQDFFGFDLDDFFGGDLFRGQFGPKQGTGSGVIYSSDGYIITNNHVVGFADDIRVVLTDKREYKAEKIGTDPSSDLALLKIEAVDLPTIPIGNSEDLQIGEWVLAVGNPFSYLTSTVTAGIVSAKGRDLDIIEGSRTIEEFIQTDAAVNPGNSGGALVDADGSLVGINTAIATPTGVFAGYSFAIPIGLVTRIIEDIKINGNIDRANLGIAGYDIDDVIADEENLNVLEGFLVKEVANGSGAQYSGVLPGDVIIRVNDTKVKSIEDIKTTMKFSKVGDTIKLIVLRDGSQKTLEVKLRKSL